MDLHVLVVVLVEAVVVVVKVLVVVVVVLRLERERAVVLRLCLVALGGAQLCDEAQLRRMALLSADRVLALAELQLLPLQPRQTGHVVHHPAIEPEKQKKNAMKLVRSTLECFSATWWPLQVSFGGYASYQKDTSPLKDALLTPSSNREKNFIVLRNSTSGACL